MGAKEGRDGRKGPERVVVLGELRRGQSQLSWPRRQGGIGAPHEPTPGTLPRLAGVGDGAEDLRAAWEELPKFDQGDPRDRADEEQPAKAPPAGACHGRRSGAKLRVGEGEDDEAWSIGRRVTKEVGTVCGAYKAFLFKLCEATWIPRACTQAIRWQEGF